MSLSNYWAVGKCLKCENKDRWVKKTAVLDKEGKLDKIVRMCAPCRLIVKYVNQIRMSAHTVFHVNVGNNENIPLFLNQIQDEFKDEINSFDDISDRVGCDGFIKLWLNVDCTIDQLAEYENVIQVFEVTEFDTVLLDILENVSNSKIDVKELIKHSIIKARESNTFSKPPRELKPDKVKLPEIKVRGDTLSND